MICRAGPDKSIAQLPGTRPNFGWASYFLFRLPRKMYRIYREYCNSDPFSRCCGMPGKWLKLGFVRPCRGTDISKCFRESLGIRDNESRLYLCYRICEKFKIHSDTKKAKKLEELSQKFLESPVYEQRRVGKVRRMPLHSQALVPAMVAHLDACPTGDQKAADSVPAGFATFFRLIMKYFLWSFSPFC